VFLKALLIGLIVYIPNQLHFPSDLGVKGLNVFNVLLLISWGAMVVHRKGQWDRVPLRGRIYLYYAALTLALLIGLAANSEYLVDDLTHFKTAITYSLLYLVFFHTVDDKHTVRLLITAVLGVVFLMSVEVLREVLAYGLDSGKRASGAFGHTLAAANYAGVFFAIFLPMAMAIAIFHRERILRLAGLMVFGFGAFSVFYTFSRAALAAVAVTSVLLCLMRSRVIGVGILILVINYALWAPEVVQRRIESTTETTQAGDEKLEASSESRFFLWSGGWEMIKERPYGVGLHQFHRMIEPHLPTWIIARDAHNHFVLITTEAGIQGGIIFVALLLGFYTLGMRMLRFRENPEARALGFGYIMSVTGLILGNLTHSFFYSGELMGNFWIMSALIARYLVLVERETESVPETTSVAVPHGFGGAGT
jgi:O-antigen ligase